ncbi:MAG: HAD family phosphatase [archaeon]
MIKAVIFDFDGVIVESHSTFNKLYANLINKELGLGIKENDFARYPGMRFEHRIEILCKLRGKNIGTTEIARITDIGRQAYFDSHSKNVDLYPGCRELLINLRNNGYKIALGSNGDREVIEKMLIGLKIKEYFDTIVTFNDVTRGKPDPEMFLKAAKSLNVSNKNCVVVEDSSEGIDAAINAGMKAIALATTTDKSKLQNADVVLNNLSDVTIKIIGSLK